ncbi:MAG TPA: hypothetical protein EYP91_01570 [Gammaproteobacteria bacterium]|nr:hypothetical protein [Gammaproteobacteria bacterium]
MSMYNDVLSNHRHYLQIDIQTVTSRLHGMSGIDEPDVCGFHQFDQLLYFNILDSGFNNGFHCSDVTQKFSG